MPISKLIFLLIFFSNSIAFSISAQTPQNRFEKITTENGLPHSVVFDIIQDQKGFIWFGTGGGLARYDGINFVPYPGNVDYIYLDREGHLWIQNKNELLSILNPTTGQISNVSELKYSVGAIFQAKNGIFYFLCKEGKILSFNKLTKQISIIVDKIDYFYRYSKSIVEDSEGMLWFGIGYQGLLNLDPKTGKYKIYNAPKNATSKYNYSIYEIFFDKDSVLWAAGEGIWNFNIETKQYDLCKPICDQIGFYKNIQKIVQDNAGNLWIATENGLISHNPYNNNTTLYKHDPDDALSISANSLNSLLIDNSNVLWISTTKGGVSKLDLNAKKFHFLQRNQKNNSSISHNLVSGIFEDTLRNVWIYAGDLTLNRWNRNTNVITKFKAENRSKNKFHSNSPYGFITGDNKGNIWVAPWLWTLNKITTKNNKTKFTHYQTTDNVSNKIPGGWAYRFILPTKDGNLWLAFADAGVDYFECTSGIFRHYKNFNRNDFLNQQNYFWSMMEDKDGNIWAGHSKNGFIKYNISSKKINNYYFPSEHILETYCILLTTDNQVYIGTNNGIFVYASDSVKFVKQYTTRDGLPHFNIRGILEDSHKNYWVSTDKGLAKIDAKTKKIRVFTKSDGLPGDEFSIGSYYKNKKGEMFFGGVNGLLYFDPDSIIDNPIQPKTVITELRILQKLVNVGDTVNGRILLQKDISYTNLIELHENDQAFTLGFASLHYSNPTKNNFLYKLEGWDKDWSLITTGQNHATYTNLPHGKYIFKVKSSNMDQIWNPIPSELTIIIHPPFWNTFWFKGMLALLFLSIILLVLWIKAKAINSQKILLKRTVEEQTKNLNQANEALKTQKDEIELQYKNIQTLAEMGQKITSSIKAIDIIERVYQSLNSVMDAEDFSIGIVNKSDNVIEFYGYSGPDNKIKASRLSLSDEDRLSVWCVHNAVPVFMTDLETEIGKYLNKKIDLYTKDKSPKSVVYMPLININKEVIGVLLAKSYQKEAYLQVHFNIIQNLASYISIALDNSNAYEEIEIQSRKLKELDELKSRFLTNISHEFKTPLTLLLGPLDKLRYEDEDISRRGLYDIMERNAQRLQRLIHQLLELSMVDEGVKRVNTSVINIGAKIKELSSTFNYLAETKQIDFEVDIPSDIKNCNIDTEKLEEIIYNLLSNAFKYTEAKNNIKPNFGAKVSIKLSIENQSNFPMICIAITDNGIGIDSNKLDKIFNRFYRVDNENVKQTEGIGVGLSLTYKLIELLEGSIEVKSVEMEETTFIVKLPYVETQEPISKHNTEIKSTVISDLLLSDNYVSDASNIPLKKILIIEDNADLRAFLKLCLIDYYQISEASNGNEGYLLATGLMPDIIICDIMMPILDGLELCKLIKTNDITSHIPVVLLTAKSANEARMEGYEVGADEYITKPFDRQVLLSRIKNILESRTRLKEKFGKAVGKDPKEVLIEVVEDKFLRNIIEIVEENISNSDFTVDKMAHLVGMGRSLFFKKFQALVGKHPNDFIRQYRLRRAASFFDKGNTDIAQVAFEVGFEYANYFARCFKEEYGSTPSEYIRTHVNFRVA
ncbi:MAG: two-component regulator propeller domain-containing protein [Bacteroidota bacterium]|nr:two-component regulator propeller domain-containing protein [Bacteroidota bacterium]